LADNLGANAPGGEGRPPRSPRRVAALRISAGESHGVRGSARGWKADGGPRHRTGGPAGEPHHPAECEWPPPTRKQRGPHPLTCGSPPAPPPPRFWRKGGRREGAAPGAPPPPPPTPASWVATAVRPARRASRVPRSIVHRTAAAAAASSFPGARVRPRGGGGSRPHSHNRDHPGDR